MMMKIINIIKLLKMNHFATIIYFYSEFFYSDEKKF